jgi:hypothetical protein
MARDREGVAAFMSSLGTYPTEEKTLQEWEVLNS